MPSYVDSVCDYRDDASETRFTRGTLTVTWTVQRTCVCVCVCDQGPEYARLIHIMELMCDPQRVTTAFQSRSCQRVQLFHEHEKLLYKYQH